MRIEKVTPQIWKVPTIIREGAITEVLASSSAEPKDKDGEYKDLENFVFFADLKYVGHKRMRNTRKVWHFFKVAGGDLELRFSHSTLDQTLTGLLDGRISMSTKNQTISGLWTFRNFAGTVACGPITVDEQQRLGA